MDCKETQSLVMDYLNRELGGEILDDFLHHIRGCRECYEELEIYYIIHFAMQRLDSEELVSYDIKGMLALLYNFYTDTKFEIWRNRGDMAV